MTTRPESEQSTIDIAQIEKSFPVPPRPKRGVRKSLPPLPPMAEIERDAAEAAASENKTIMRVEGSKLARDLSLARGNAGKGLPLSLGVSTAKPPRPLSKDEPRPTTASTFTSIDPKRNLKYGTGKYARTELSPQPSEDPDDPLNWPWWKKNLNFAILLCMVAVASAMKTALMSVHSVVSADESVSYTAAAALTAVPLMISALSGMGSTIIARIWGKRPVYLVSTVLMFIGCAWNINTRGDFAQNMAARIFQGLGWGAFDTLVLGSILDTFFEHERQTRILLYNTVSVGVTWGGPLIGGAASVGARGFLTQFEILTSFLVVLMPFIVFGAPETTYTRSSFDENDTFPALTRSQSRFPTITLSKDAVLQYIRNVKLLSYKAIMVDRFLLMQAPRAAAAPSTILLFAITLLPYVALWGLSSSLSLLFTPAPFRLAEPSIGLLFFTPFLLGTATVVGISLLLRQRHFSRTVHLVTLAVGASFASIGILGFGLYIVGSAQRPGGGGVVIWDLSFTRNSISFPVISFLLGLLALGSAALDSTIQPVVQQSTAFTSANMNVALRNIADMHAGLTCLRNIVAGAFVLGIPTAIRTWDGLRGSAIGMGIVQIFITAVAAAVYFDLAEDVRRLDGVVMGLVDLSALKHRGSFFDAD
ncbi:putative major facilitator superfamily transporter [Rosellinia necatrix]|uniref:Putative major facilitator superfamily transporter n=1 Tax=Rosellinia necatrix TaxID=77044 RepID=A0A1S7UHQ7_ROSNE|nr:putative major facilitator superfamily transporter [Rosellinia necatrix]